jgi:hypothetical protein
MGEHGERKEPTTEHAPRFCSVPAVADYFGHASGSGQLRSNVPARFDEASPMPVVSVAVGAKSGDA